MFQTIPPIFSLAIPLSLLLSSISFRETVPVRLRLAAAVAAGAAVHQQLCQTAASERDFACRLLYRSQVAHLSPA